MPRRRTFVIKYVEGPYHDPSIRCENCLTPFTNGYYDVFEEGVRVNLYPFHSIACAEGYFRTSTWAQQNIVFRYSIETIDNQEEETE